MVRLTPTSFIHLHDMLIDIRNVATRMTIEGYDVFQPSEQWEYAAQHGVGYMGVCPVCYRFDLDPLWFGDNIRGEFSMLSWEDKPRVIHPQTHDDHDLDNGMPIRPAAGEPKRCRCRLHWINFPDPIVEQLVREMTEATS